MASRLESYQRLQQSGIVAVMRRMKPEKVVEIVAALQRAGVTAIEITVEHADGYACLDVLKKQFGAGLLLGAGTVLDTETAKRALETGADFIVTPVVKTDVIALANRYGVLIGAGAMTPSEILTAYEAGADIVKVFPADTLGADYLKHVKGPLGHIPLMPTGGINLNNLADYVRNGALCVGVGSALYQYETAQEIEQEASRFVQAYQGAKNAKK
ncbi:bifunctional 4-hydroxy-2-oxoglutarate aldolase/2-dehydro-3-deoxy-phosphogluconate aldolase [Brevibacillus fulvus]|uniref:2-dehydro-3-deoxyphosphogluconate aldolase/(4S)-4-hydroxy-2-oxoglutarate aldolase n=1 Tax=Brevibacillus fulvus TaxID=1125967 RepID=A0A939BTB7_9BACL|nr:bifunctional 4-hydroxy-2-oxoglutarate aldolase/2-dehydro-3-deoxy-phosphogluconate aldolase [Brevibacillus fulvus]MBM7591348.1 2-dehydro-3-deoxyphosphogluconate aldolase/(4S)-4-hydroxy-2-oxoglutarate aldolase [Brevibacillus fulvus]